MRIEGRKEERRRSERERDRFALFVCVCVMCDAIFSKTLKKNLTLEVVSKTERIYTYSRRQWKLMFCTPFMSPKLAIFAMR